MMGRIQSLAIFPVLFCLTFLLLGMAVNLLQLVFYLSTPTQLFRRINYYLMYCVFGYIISMADWWNSSRFNVYADEKFAKQVESGEGRNALCVMNHHTELDWLFSLMGADRLGVMGNCKVFAKDSLKYIPIMGWAMTMSDIMFLKRDWDSDRENISRKLNTIFTYPSPVWLLLFPEGTRFSADKHRASLEFAAKEGLPLLQHHLLPRTKGFTFTVDHIDRSKVEIVYDVTLVENASSVPFNMTSVMSGKQIEGNMLVRHIPLSSIPRDQTESAAWLINLFKEKDELKQTFLSTGSFGPAYRKVTHHRSLATLLLLLFSNIIVVSIIAVALATGGTLLRSCIVASFGLAWVAMTKMNAATTIENSSRHGLKKGVQS